MEFTTFPKTFQNVYIAQRIAKPQSHASPPDFMKMLGDSSPHDLMTNPEDTSPYDFMITRSSLT